MKPCLSCLNMFYIILSGSLLPHCPLLLLVWMNFITYLKTVRWSGSKYVPWTKLILSCMVCNLCFALHCPARQMSFGLTRESSKTRHEKPIKSIWGYLSVHQLGSSNAIQQIDRYPGATEFSFVDISPMIVKSAMDSEWVLSTFGQLKLCIQYSCDCDDHSCLHIFLRSSNIWSFIYIYLQTISTSVNASYIPNFSMDGLCTLTN